MHIVIEENKNMNHHYIKLVVHPQMKYLAEKLIEMSRTSFKNIKVYDEMNNMYFISIISIIYIEVVDHRLYVYTKGNTYHLHYYSLKELMRKEKLKHFCQINAQTLVNMNYIHSYHIDQDCRRKIFLETGECLVVNRSYKEYFEKSMKAQKPIVKL